MKKMKNNLLSKNNLWMYLSGIIFFGLGIVQNWWVYGLAGLLLFVLILFGEKKKMSKGLYWYLVVMILMGVLILWVESKEVIFKNFVLFVLGGGWMYLGGGMKKEKGFGRKLTWIITALGLGWLMIFLWNEFFVQGLRIGSRGLVWWGTHTKDHHHLGDWWALVVLSQMWLLKRGDYKNFDKKKLSLFLILAGVVWIYFSRSRSAILSVILGLLFLFGGKLWKEKLFKWVMGGLVLAFLLLGMSKPTFFNRQYWLQGIVGWWRYPLGVGIGNFGTLSADVRNHLFNLGNYSSVAHNVLLEFLAGMGVFGLSFWWWSIKYIVEPFLTKKVNPSLVSGLVLALGINFLFDMTYLVAPMWWIFMFLLGVQTKDVR